MGLRDFFSKKKESLWSGYRPMRPREDAKAYASSGDFGGSLPAMVDLRPFLTPVEDQGDTNSCTANAVAGACEYLIKRKMGDSTYDVSRLFIYYNARKRAEDRIKDEGCVIQYAVESIQDLGVCPEKIWPFDKRIVNRRPSETSYDLGQRFKVGGMENVPVELDVWRQALAEGHPIVFGTELYESFDDCTANGGFVSMPAPDESGRASHGGHAMLCVGYSDQDSVFIVRNSWGASWGDRGYCYMPYNYLINDRLTGDCWVLRSPYGIEDPKAGWVADPKPLNGGRYKTLVYDVGSYTGRPTFYDNPILKVLTYIELLPAAYNAIVDLFFDEKTTLDDWKDDDPDSYEFDEAEDLSDDEDEEGQEDEGGEEGEDEGEGSDEGEEEEKGNDGGDEKSDDESSDDGGDSSGDGGD